MKYAELTCRILVLLCLLVVGNGEVYIVRVEGEPIISYRGSTNGFEATAVESDEKIDVHRYYTGYPKDLGPSKIIHFSSERQFVQLLHEGYPVVVAFTIRGNYTRHLDKVIEESAAEFYPHVKFMRVECPKYPGFCISRQHTEYPFIEIFHSPAQASSQGKVADPNVTKYFVKVLPFNYDLSAYGFREFFKRYSIFSSAGK